MADEVILAEAAYCVAMDRREAAFQKLRELDTQHREAVTAYNEAEDAVTHAQRKLLDAVYDSREAARFLPESAPGRRAVADRPQA